MRKFDLMSSVCHAPAGNGNGNRRAPKADLSKTHTFRDGDTVIPVTDDEAIGAHYRAEAAHVAPGVTNVQIAALVKTIPGDDADDVVYADRIIAVEGASPVTHATPPDATIPTVRDVKGKEVAPLSGTMSAIPNYRRDAVKWGTMLNDTAFGKNMVKAADAKEDFEGAALLICDDLERIFGEQRDDKGKVTREGILDQWPVPGSGSKAWNENHPGWNGPTDHYEFTNSTDGTKIKGTVFGDIWDASTEGQRIHAHRMALREIVENKYAILTSTPPDLRYLDGRGEVAVKAAIKRWDARRTNPLARFKKAIAFLQAKAKLREFPLIALLQIEDKLDIAAKMGAPFKLVPLPAKDATKEEDAKLRGIAFGPFSMAQIIGLRYDELAQKPAAEQTAAMLVTLSRRQKGNGASEQGKSGASAEGLDFNIRNWKEVDGALSALSTYLDDDGNLASMYSILNGNTENKWLLLDNIQNMEQHLKAILVKYMPQITAREDERRKAANAEAIAKQGKAA